MFSYTLKQHDPFNVSMFYCVHDKCVCVTMAWRVFRVWMEERPPIWRVAGNTLNKQPWTTNKGWSSSLGVGLLTVKTSIVTKHMHVPWTWTNPLVRGMQWKRHEIRYMEC